MESWAPDELTRAVGVQRQSRRLEPWKPACHPADTTRRHRDHRGRKQRANRPTDHRGLRGEALGLSPVPAAQFFHKEHVD